MKLGTKINTGLRAWLIAALLLAGLLVSAQAADEEPSQDEYKIPPPSFKPGAAVSLQVLLVAPAGWHLNPLLPITLKFDKDYLKSAPFTLTQENWTFKIKDEAESYTALIPLKVGARIEDGEYEVPLHLDCSICQNSVGACTFASEDLSFKLLVRGSVDKGSKDQGLAKGIIALTRQISAPE